MFEGTWIRDQSFYQVDVCCNSVTSTFAFDIPYKSRKENMEMLDFIKICRIFLWLGMWLVGFQEFQTIGLAGTLLALFLFLYCLVINDINYIENVTYLLSVQYKILRICLHLSLLSSFKSLYIMMSVIIIYLLVRYLWWSYIDHKTILMKPVVIVFHGGWKHGWVTVPLITFGICNAVST